MASPPTPASADEPSAIERAQQLRAAGELDLAIEALQGELTASETASGRRRLAAMLLVAERTEDAALALRRGIDLSFVRLFFLLVQISWII